MVYWYNPNGTRTYQYYVKVSNDKNNYLMVADRSENRSSDAVADNLEGRGRYVKVDVLGGNGSTAYPSLYEVEIYGWMIESDEYVIDFE